MSPSIYDFGSLISYQIIEDFLSYFLSIIIILPLSKVEPKLKKDSRYQRSFFDWIAKRKLHLETMEDWYQVERPTIYQIPGAADILDGFYNGSVRNAIQVRLPI